MASVSHLLTPGLENEIKYGRQYDRNVFGCWRKALSASTDLWPDTDAESPL